MKMPIDKEWFEKHAAAEGDLEIGAGSHKLTMTLNLTDAEIAALEQVALEALPAWARDRITVMRAALLAIRDADDIHPSSSTHDVEQSRHRFCDIARHALAGYAPALQSTGAVARIVRAAADDKPALVAEYLDGPRLPFGTLLFTQPPGPSPQSKTVVENAALLIAKNALANQARRVGPLTIEDMEEVFARLANTIFEPDQKPTSQDEEAIHG